MACASSFDPDDRLEPVRPSYQPRRTPPPFIEPDPSDDKSSPRDRKASCYNNFRDYCLLYSGLAREDALYADRLDRPTDLSTRSAPPPPPPVQPAASTVCSAASFLDLPSASAAATSSSRALPAHHHPQQWPRPSLSCPSSTMLADAPPPDPPRGSSLDKYRLRPSPSLNTSLPSLQPATAPMSASLSAPVSALTPQSGRMLPSFRAAFPESPEPAPPRPLDPPLQLQSLSVSSPPPSSTRAYPVEPSFPHYHSPQGSHVSLPSIVPSPAYLPPVKTEYPVYPYAVRDHPVEYRPRPTDYSHHSQEALPLTSPIDKASPPRKSHRTATGAYKCPHPGCKAEPFQTQYLLNSHANVHSHERPYYCPVKNCVHAEGGKGFKRKNEMIRHQLVHSSPGYECPFCLDQKHRYPRPDNLQRDKGRDDPDLANVLAQRPSGGIRGRRRRTGT